MNRLALMLSVTMLRASTANAGEMLSVHSDAPARVIAPSGAIVGTCSGDCRYEVERGRYVVEVDETNEAPGRTRSIDVRGPMSVDVRSGSSSTRSAGLALAVVGTVAVPVGLIGVLANMHVCWTYCGNDHKTDNESAQIAWGLVALGGAAASATGWVLWATSNTKIRARREATLTLVPTYGGAFGGVAIAF